MKNSAETSSGFSLFSIDEHRLSVGLLVLFLLSITGYGVWLLIAPFMPQMATAETTQSRKMIADQSLMNKDWGKAIENFGEMLRDDPENGYAVLGVASALEAQLRDKWNEYENVGSTTGSAQAGEDLLAEETRLFNAATNSWKRLLDNARYQQTAYEHLADLRCGRAVLRKSKDELDEAVRLLDEMFQKGIFTSSGIDQRGELFPLRNHPDYSRLVQQEDRLSNPGRRIRSPLPPQRRPLN